MEFPSVASARETVFNAGAGDGPFAEAWQGCLVEDADKKRKISTPVGVQCMTMRKRPEDCMEWAIGCVAEGMDHAVPGTYTGMIREWKPMGVGCPYCLYRP